MIKFLFLPPIGISYDGKSYMLPIVTLAMLASEFYLVL